MGELVSDIGEAIKYAANHPERILSLAALFLAGCASTAEVVLPVAHLEGAYCPTTEKCDYPDTYSRDIMPEEVNKDLWCPTTNPHFTGFKKISEIDGVPILMSQYDDWTLVLNSCKKTALPTPTPKPTPTNTTVVN